MKASELKAELNVKMIELGKCIDLGMPYGDIKKIYERIKQLQFELALTESTRRDAIVSKHSGLTIE